MKIYSKSERERILAHAMEQNKRNSMRKAELRRRIEEIEEERRLKRQMEGLV